MERVCFTLQVRPERLEEYKQRHRAVWPEMRQALQETGWRNYSLFLRPDGLLIGYLETDDFAKAKNEMAKRAINDKWQREMADFFVAPDGVLPDRAMSPARRSFSSRIKEDHDTKSSARRNLPLAGRARFRQLLCSVSRRQTMVLGNVLAGRRHF